MRRILSLVCGLLLVSSLGSQEPPEVAKKARAVFEKHCYSCHGKKGANEGGMNYVLNRERLVAARKVVPKDFKKSRLFRRMRDEEMPPEADAAGNPIKVRLTDEDMDAVKRWIAAGAPDFAPKSKPRPFIANTDI